METDQVVAAMRQDGGPVLGDVCDRCGRHRRVAVTNQTFGEMIDTVRPVLHSISADERSSGRRYHAVGPGCDAYALGVELAQPFTFLDTDGRTKTIRDIEVW